MAAKISFKQQCPSCEHPVPIRDPKLIGRKIDCPKCKYRFVVEEPAQEADADAESNGSADKAETAVTAKKNGVAKNGAAAATTATKPAKGKAAPTKKPMK